MNQTQGTSYTCRIKSLKIFSCNNKICAHIHTNTHTYYIHALLQVKIYCYICHGLLMSVYSERTEYYIDVND